MSARAKILLAARVGKQSAEPGRTAAWLAERLGGDVTLLYVATELRTTAEVAVAAAIPDDAVRERIRAEASDRVTSWGRDALGGMPFDVLVEDGEVADRVAEVAERLGADLVVVGTEARGALRGMILGDTTRDILRRCACPVVVVPPGAEGS